MRCPCSSFLLTATMPLLGSIVQNGKLAACACVPSQSALNRVDCSSTRSRQNVTRMHRSTCEPGGCCSMQGTQSVPCPRSAVPQSLSSAPCMLCSGCTTLSTSVLSNHFFEHAQVLQLLAGQHLKLRDCSLLKNCCNRICHRMPLDAAGEHCDRKSEAPVCIAAVRGRLCMPCRCLTAPQLLHVLLTYVWSCIDLCILHEASGRRRFTV